MKFNKKLIPVVIILVFIGLSYVVKNNPPSSKRFKPSSAPQLNVEVKTLVKQDMSLNIKSYGNVRPRTQSNLFPQVSGQITYISPNFREGGFFEKGEVLVKIDQRDYLAEIEIAKSSLFNAQQVLSEENARVEQAQQDWQRLGNKEQAPDLVLRKPQLLAAQANVYSAQANLKKAELALERTQIVAPYQGRILNKEVDVGQVVSSGTKLAAIYAVDYVEVRLPLKNKDLSYISLPELGNGLHSENAILPSVTIASELVERQHWQGKIVRTEGAFDASSQQLFVVAQIDDPYKNSSQQGLPIKIGQYVTADITGKMVHDALIIPNLTIYQGSYVYVVENNKLVRKPITIAWQNEEFALIKSGLSEQDLLVITPLGQINSGTPVTITGLDGKAVVSTRKKNPSSKSKARSEQAKGDQL